MSCSRCKGVAYCSKDCQVQVRLQESCMCPQPNHTRKCCSSCLHTLRALALECLRCYLVRHKLCVCFIYSIMHRSKDCICVSSSNACLVASVCVLL